MLNNQQFGIGHGVRRDATVMLRFPTNTEAEDFLIWLNGRSPLFPKEWWLYQRAFNKWGKEAQIRQAIEEMAELTIELCKLPREVNGSTVERVLEELADVQVMTGQLAVLFGPEKVFRVKEDKLARLKGLLDKG